METKNSDTALGVEGVTVDDCAAYTANYAAHKEGISQKEVVAHYNNNADDYEENLAPGRYNGPKYAASVVQKYYPEIKTKIRILDAAAGTGFLGQLLQDAGFVNIDALDPSSSMLELAEKKNVYSKLICDAFDHHTLTVADDTYDVVVGSGGMGEGHIPCAGLLEMARITKPGGIVCIVMREEYLSYVKEYKDRLEPFMEEMVGRGIWTKEERTIVSCYSFGKNGVIYVFRVGQEGCAAFASNVLKK